MFGQIKYGDKVFGGSFSPFLTVVYKLLQIPRIIQQWIYNDLVLQRTIIGRIYRSGNFQRKIVDLFRKRRRQ